MLDKPENEPYEFWMYVEDTRSLFARKFSIAGSPLQQRIDMELSGAIPPPLDNPERSAEVSESKKLFWTNIVSHFDILTQQTLMIQTHEWPSHAYPPL